MAKQRSLENGIRIMREDVALVSEKFTHHQTNVDDKTIIESGSTEWVAEMDGRLAWIRWRWQLMNDEMVVFGDLAEIKSNLVPVDGNLNPFTQILGNAIIMTIAYLLPWQDIVNSEVSCARKAH